MNIQLSRPYLSIIFYLVFLIPILIIGWFLFLINSENSLILMGWLGTFLILIAVLTWKKTTGDFFAPYVVFLLSLFIFSYGQAVLMSIGIFYEPFNLYELYNIESLLIAHYFTIIGISFFHLGALTSQSNKIINHNEHIDIRDKNIKESLKIVGWILFLGSFYFYFESLLQIFNQSIKHGYMSLYNYENRTLRETSIYDNIQNTIKMFFIPSIFLLLIYYKKNNFVKNSIVFVIIVAVVLNFAAGTRTDAAALLISFALVWHEQIKIFKSLNFIKLFIGALMLLIIFNVTGDLRGYTNRDVNVFFEIIKESIFLNNPVFESIGEMGGSMFPLLEVMNLVSSNQIDIKYGLTYISSIFAVFPSFMVGNLLPRESLANWLMLTLNMNYGPGFSLLAEAFLNFKWLGALFMFGIGFAISKLLSPQQKDTDYNILKKTLVCSFLYFIITIGRGETLLLVRYAMLFYFLPLFMIHLIASYLNNFKTSFKKVN